MNNPNRIGFDVLTPFAVVIASVGISEVHAVAGLLLTFLGIVYTGRKLWVSFKQPDTRDDE